MSREQQARLQALGADVRESPRAGAGGGLGTSLLTLFAAALGAAGVGFGAYVYAVPYARVSRELKRQSGELMAEQTQLETQLRELEQIKQDLAQTRGPSALAEGAWRVDFKLIAAGYERKLGELGLKGARVDLQAARLRVVFPEDAVFDGRGPWFTKNAQAALEALGQSVGSKAGRVVITAPMAGGKVPAWVRDTHPTPADLSAARVRTALKALQKGGVPGASLWGVTAGGPTGAEDGPATLELDIEPRGL